MKKTVIVTGGMRGIGFAIAKKFGESGYNVTIADICNVSDYTENANTLKQDKIDYLILQGDIRDPLFRKELVERTVEHFGEIDVLINNAGVAPRVRSDLLEMTEESFDYVVGTNTKGTMFTTQAVVKQMLKQPIENGRRGSIVNISSDSAEISSISRGEYCISKAGVSMLTLLYADRLACEGIVVNEVRPGIIATDMTKCVRPKYDRYISEGNIPIARWGYPEDIANAAFLLASENFSYTTGNYINVDGGMHIRSL